MAGEIPNPLESYDAGYQLGFKAGQESVLYKVAKAYDLLGGMWSWSEDNGFFLKDCTTWYCQAGRMLREIIGRPAKNPYE